MPEGSSNSSFLIIFMVLAVAVLFFMNSRARKRQTAAVAFRDTLAPGQEVMTSAGMFGTVVAVDGDKVTLVNSGGQESVWLLAAIAKLVDDDESATGNPYAVSDATDDDGADLVGDLAASDQTDESAAVEQAADETLQGDVTADDLATEANPDPRDDTTR